MKPSHNAPSSQPAAGQSSAAVTVLRAVLAVLTIAGGSVAASVPVATAASITVEQAVRMALANNPDLLAARQQLTAAKANLVKARYWNPFNPTVSAGAAQRRFGSGASAVEPTVNVSVTLEIAGQRSARIKEAEGNLAKVQAQIRDAERRVRADLKLAFYRVLYLRRRLELFRTLEAQNRRLRDASQARFVAGESSKLEANLAAIRYVQSRRDTLAAMSAFKNAVRGLELMLGLKPTATVDPVGQLTMRRERINPRLLVQIALDGRPDLRARIAEIERVQSSISLTKRLIVPNLVLGGFFTQEANKGIGNDDILGGMAGFSIPLFVRTQAELVALEGELRRARYDRLSNDLRIRTQVRDAIQSYDAASEAVSVFEGDAVGRTQESFRFIEIAYQRGKIDLLQFVVLQNDLVRSSLTYLGSLWDYWQARINLELAVGVDLDKVVAP